MSQATELSGQIAPAVTQGTFSPDAHPKFTSFDKIEDHQWHRILRARKGRASLLALPSGASRMEASLKDMSVANRFSSRAKAMTSSRSEPSAPITGAAR